MDSTRLIDELIHHDRQARERADYFANNRQELVFSDDLYLDHETWIRPAIEHLGLLNQIDLLDYGCGHGMASVVFARMGARVTAFDLSGEYVREAQARAIANGVLIRCLQADAEELPFMDQSFDAVWGSAILHHLDLHRAGLELDRILRPGGVAVFCEPWGQNPVLEFARRWLPYPGKDRTADEHPLRANDLIPLRRWFPTIQIHGFQLLGMIRRLLRRTVKELPFLDRWDQTLIQRFPKLEKFCRYVVIVLKKA